MTERVTWTRRLSGVPDWALREELMRRGEEPDQDQAVRLPGLVVDPVGGEVVWHGVSYAVTGRTMEVLYALALAHAAGRRGVRSNVLAARVFVGFDHRDAIASLRTYITQTRRRIPGLLPMSSSGGGAYGIYRLAVERSQPTESVA